MYSNIAEAWNKDPVKEITNKLSKNRKLLSPIDSEINSSPNFIGSSDSITLSDVGSLSLMSEKKNSPKLNKSILKNTKFIPTTTESDGSEVCTNSIKHLKSCDHCYHRLKQMIDNKVNKKFDELILDNRLKEIQNSGLRTNVNQQTVPISNLALDSLLLRNNEPKTPIVEKPGYVKETLIIIIGIIIILLIIFLIVKVIQK